MAAEVVPEFVTAAAPVVVVPTVTVAAAPSAPFVPLLPAGPVGPAAPSAPFAPAGPVGPVGPAAPFDPAGPVGPVGPTDPPPPHDAQDDATQQYTAPVVDTVTTRAPTHAPEGTVPTHTIAGLTSTASAMPKRAMQHT
jgi:hypothetical protein